MRYAFYLDLKEPNDKLVRSVEELLSAIGEVELIAVNDGYQDGYQQGLDDGRLTDTYDDDNYDNDDDGATF